MPFTKITGKTTQMKGFEMLPLADRQRLQHVQERINWTEEQVKTLLVLVGDLISRVEKLEKGKNASNRSGKSNSGA